MVSRAKRSLERGSDVRSRGFIDGRNFDGKNEEKVDISASGEPFGSSDCRSVRRGNYVEDIQMICVLEGYVEPNRTEVRKPKISHLRLTSSQRFRASAFAPVLLFSQYLD
jgi:hypothetical protein